LNWLQRGFKNALERAGISDFHFHDLRHTFASLWMMNQGDLYVLRDILGHKTVAMTTRYAHIAPAYKKAMVDRMERIWSPATASSVGNRATKTLSLAPSGHGDVTNVTQRATA
jgi:hypothetical protein